MKIAIVSTTYPPHSIGGAERSVQELARGLAAAGDTVRVFCLGPEDKGNTVELDRDVEVHRFGSPAFRPFMTGGKNASSAAKLRWHVSELFRLPAYLYLRRRFRSFQPDVVHTNNLAGFGWLAWRAAGAAALVHTIRDYYLVCMSSTDWRNGAPCGADHLPCRVSKAPFRHARRRPELFVGISDDVVSAHREYRSIRTNELSRTIYNRPQIASASIVGSASADPAPVESGKPFVFGLLGRVGEDKGTFTVVEALKAIDPGFLQQGVELRVAGEGTEGDLERLRAAAESDPRIRYVGRQNPRDFYAAVDCALIPTQWREPFGRTAAEALMLDVPVLASHTGGLPEVVQIYGGRARLVGDHTNPTAWSRAMADATVELPNRVEPSRFTPNNAVDMQYRDAYDRVDGAA